MAEAIKRVGSSLFTSNKCRITSKSSYFKLDEYNKKAKRGREDGNHLISVSIQFLTILHVLVVKITISFSHSFLSFAAENFSSIYSEIIIEISI
jgi:hypothetical protein